MVQHTCQGSKNILRSSAANMSADPKLNISFEISVNESITCKEIRSRY